MTAKEGKELTIKYIDKFMADNGFKLVKNNSSEVKYKRKTSIGYDEFGSSSSHYNPIQVFGFGVGKSIKQIENIAKS